MGQILHGRARTTGEVRREIQHSKESLKVLSQRYGVNFKTILKWKHWDYVYDSPMGPKNPHSTVLSREEEAICVAFRKHTLLPLDDTMRETIPKLTRASLHRMFKRNGINRLPKGESVEKSQRKSSKIIKLAISTLILQRFARKRVSCFVAIDRSSKFVYARL